MENVWLHLPKPFLCLAPMEGVTDTVFRRVVMAAAAPDLFFTEFTSMDGLVSKGFNFVAERLQYLPEEKPLIAQVWGVNPDNFYKGANLISKMGFDGIDINMGCPDRAVVKSGGGSALIGEYSQVSEIIEAVKKGAPNLPVSVKTRIGKNKIITEEWIGFLLEQNLVVITVHGRTLKELSKVPAHWDEIGKAVMLRNTLSPQTVIVGNGDVASRTDAEEKAAEFGVDGVMIGRGVFQNPWVFEKIPTKHSKAEKMALLQKHLELFSTHPNNKRPVVALRKFFKIYANGFPGALSLRVKLMEATNLEEIATLLSP